MSGVRQLPRSFRQANGQPVQHLALAVHSPDLHPVRFHLVSLVVQPCRVPIKRASQGCAAGVRLTCL